MMSEREEISKYKKKGWLVHNNNGSVGVFFSALDSFVVV
jgi:hypothetical protein